MRDDAARLEACLQSIRSNAYAADGVEIVVIDNGSRDASAAVAQHAGARVVPAPSGRVSELRNLGAAAARADIVAFVDADHILAPGWIGAAVAGVHEDAAIGAVGSLCRAPDDGTWVQRAYDRLRGQQIGRRPVDWLGAGNMVVRRAAFERVGGFDPSLETCEDVDLCKRLRAAGYSLIADDRLINVHVGDPATLGALFRGELWRGRNNLPVTFRRPLALRELYSAVAPVLQLAGLAVAAASLWFAGTLWALAAVVALLPCAAVPALRAARMSARVGRWNPREVADNVVVAFVYDMARALALVSFAGHGVRRR